MLKKLNSKYLEREGVFAVCTCTSTTTDVRHLLSGKIRGTKLFSVLPMHTGWLRGCLAPARRSPRRRDPCRATSAGAPEPKTSPTNLYTSAKRRSSGDNGSWIVTSCCDDKQSATQASSRGASFSPPFAVAVNESSWLGQHGPPPGKEHDAGQSIERRCGRMTAAERRGCGGGSAAARPSLWALRKYFCAWLRICVAVLVATNRSMVFQSRPNMSSACRKRSCSSAVHFSRGREIVYGFRGLFFPAAGVPERFLALFAAVIIFCIYVRETESRDERWLARSCGVDT
jgi:hypothetical protein